MNQMLRKLISGLLIVVFLVSGGLLLRLWRDGQAGDAAYARAEELAGLSKNTAAEAPRNTGETEAVEEPEGTEPARTVWVPVPVEDDPHMVTLAGTDLAALRQVNPEVAGWIMIPDTGINFPLLQGQDNEFYLKHTWEGTQNDYGSIFLECMNSPDLTDFNTIIYGHNMSDGSMFAQLHRYADPEFRNDHPYIYIVTDAGVYRYEVFSTYFAPVDSSTYGLSFKQEATRQAFIEMALAESGIDAGISPAVTDRIITLSTCTGRDYESRRVVHARLEMTEITVTE